MVFVGTLQLAQSQPVKKSSISLPISALNTIPIRVSALPLPSSASAFSPNLSPNFYAANLGFFCQQEIKIEKAVKFPVKFRLGSVEACNHLEGKYRRP